MNHLPQLKAGNTTLHRKTLWRIARCNTPFFCSQLKVTHHTPLIKVSLIRPRLLRSHPLYLEGELASRSTASRSAFVTFIRPRQQAAMARKGGCEETNFIQSLINPKGDQPDDAE